MIRAPRIPVLVAFLGLVAALMLVPALHGLARGDYRVARGFFFHAVATWVMLAGLMILQRARSGRRADHEHLASLLAGFVLVPLIAALPIRYASPGMGLVQAWFESVSAFTTTGATLFAPGELGESLHLWRALLGWFGGLVTWVAAFAILAPLNLGGFEVVAPRRSRRQEQAGHPKGDGRARIMSFAYRLAPPYLGITAALAVMLALAGDRGIVAVSHAMAIVSTSGISPLGGVEEAASGRVGEIIMALFLIFALTHATVVRETRRGGLARLLADPELRLGLWLVLVLSGALFLHHWVGAQGGAAPSQAAGAGAALRALWGAVFTTLSFLTTTGFASTDWVGAEAWSGLPAPGLLLMFLAMVGGGYATTAGGIKLIRVIALFRHGRQELEQMVHPSQVRGSGGGRTRIGKEGIYMAWVFFMLFVLSLSAVVVLLSLTGLDFERAFLMGMAALSTTGPIATYADATAFSYAALSDLSQVVLGLAMILGRFETLALIALLNPGFWR